MPNLNNSATKVAGYIDFCENNTIKFLAWYGDVADVGLETPHQKIIASPDGTVLEETRGIQNFRTINTNTRNVRIKISKLAQQLPILSPTMIKKLCSLGKQQRGATARVLFTFSADNQLSFEPIVSTTSINSFYHTTKNPKPAQRPAKRYQINLSDIIKKSHHNKYHPRIAVFDHSASSAPVSNSSISLLNGPELVKSITKNHQNLNYKDALKKHIKNTLQMNKSSSLIYQSICVPQNEDNNFGLHGAGYIKKSPDFFVEELTALYELRQNEGFNRIKINIPNVKSINELQAIKEILRKNKITRSHHFELLISADLPAVLLQLSEFMDEGVDGIVFDVLKSAKFMMGLNTQMLQDRALYNDRSLLHALSTIVEKAQTRKLPVYVVAPPNDKLFIDKIPNFKNVQVIGQ